MTSPTDLDLVARCRDGDDAAWGELVDRYARYVLAIATRGYRLQGTDAEDVFQEVLARVYEHLDRLHDAGSLQPWIAQVTRRCCVDLLRAGARVVPVAEPDEVAVDGEIARLDEAMTVQAALGTLSPDCREVLDRFFCRDESYHTIGDALGIPSGTIASRIARCLGRLRGALEGRNPASHASGEMVGGRP